MKTTKNSFWLSLLVCLISLVTTSCEKEEIPSFISKPYKGLANTFRFTPGQQAVGTWQLVEIEYGWTGAKDMPPKPMEMTIDNSLNVVFYEDGKETYRFQYVLTEDHWGVHYTTINKSGRSSIYIQEVGRFRVSDKKLIVGDTGNDGNHYTFQRK